MRKKYKLYITLTVIVTQVLSVGISDAEQGFSTPSRQTSVTSKEGDIIIQPTPSTVLAPEGLEAQEQRQLQEQYAFTYRNKALILNPYLSGAGEGDGVTVKTGEAAEQEKLYRYFGVADKLYKEGRMQEAIDMLRYILKRNPDDRYVKSYLDRVTSENELRKMGWKAISKNDAGKLKEKKIRDLLRDGMDYYKQKRFDAALMKFSDLLEMDPGNKTAEMYMGRLKSYYLDDVKAEDIVNSYEDGRFAREIAGKEARPDDAAIDKKTSNLLDDQQKRIDAGTDRLLDAKEDASVKTAGALLDKIESRPSMTDAAKLLDRQEFQEIVKEKRSNSIMDEADLAIEVNNIINRKKVEEIRSNFFTLGPGDILQIAVRDHPELSGSAVVRLNGTIALPLVNEAVPASGFTVSEVAENVKLALKRYVKDANVLIAVQEYHSKTFYVIDETGAKPYNITRANFTLRDALFVSDWGNDRALGRVLVMKPDKLHPIIRKIDAFDIIYRGNLANNIKIDNGDIIYVPLTIAAKTTKVINDTISPFKAFRAARDEWVNVKADQKSYIEIPKWRQSVTEMDVTNIWSNVNSGSSGV